MFPKTGCLILIFILTLALIPAGAQSLLDNFYWSYNGTVALLASNNGKQGADPPQVVPSLGFSIGYRFFKYMRVDFTEDIYFTNYEYNFTRGYPMACSSENRKAFVLGFTTGLQATGAFPISKKGVTIRVFGGIAFDLRLAIQAFGMHPDDAAIVRAHTEAISKYFWSKGRFLFAPFGAGMDFPVNTGFLIGFDLRAWAPLYRIWTGENIPAIDGWRFGLSLRVTPPKRSAAR